MTVKNSVAYLSYDGLTDPLGQSQILPYIVGLEAKGFVFTVISFEKPEAYMASRSIIESLIEGKKISWIPLKYHKRPPVLSTLLDIYFLWRTMLKEHKQNPFAILHCRSYITALVGLRMKRKTGIKFVFDMRGFWADERVEGGIWNLKNPIYRTVYQFFKKKEKSFLKEADHIISLTHNAKNEIESWGFTTAPITVIPTCVDLRFFDPQLISEEDRTRKRIELGVTPNEFLLVYIGSWGTWYLTIEIVKFFEILIKEKSDSKFLIVTPDDPGHYNRDLFKNIIIRKANRSEMPLLLSCANGTVFFIKTSFSKKASSATKLGEIMAMNIPVVTNSGWGDIDQYLSEGVIVLRDTSDEQLKEGAIKLLSARSLSNSQLESLSLTFGINQYDQLYQSLLC